MFRHGNLRTSVHIWENVLTATAASKSLCRSLSRIILHSNTCCCCPSSWLSRPLDRLVLLKMFFSVFNLMSHFCHCADDTVAAVLIFLITSGPLIRHTTTENAKCFYLPISDISAQCEILLFSLAWHFLWKMKLVHKWSGTVSLIWQFRGVLLC